MSCDNCEHCSCDNDGHEYVSDVCGRIVRTKCRCETEREIQEQIIEAKYNAGMREVEVGMCDRYDYPEDW